MKDNTVKIAYFGAAAFRITTAKGKKILIDPYLTENSLCRKELDYFYDADFLVVSHGSYDHFGDTIEIMKQSQATLVCGGDVARHCIRMKIPKERIKSTVYGDQKEFEGIKIKAVYASHQSRIESGTETFYGSPMGFIITTENGIRIYHAGDTALFGDFRVIGMYYRPNIFLVGVSGMGGSAPTEMGPGEAALATQWVAPDVVVPMHYPAGSDAPGKFLGAIEAMAPCVEPIAMEPNSEITYNRYRVEAGEWL